jgi:hypothetical protein
MLSKGGALTRTVDRHWKYMSENSRPAIGLIRNIQAMRSRHVEQNAQQVALLFVLHSARLAKSSFERDKIYAVQHLASRGKRDKMMLDPDNSAGWQTVYEKLATRYLKIRGSAILSYAGRAIQHDHNLPSWVPDWTYENWYRLTRKQWKAGGPSEPKGQIRFLQDNKILSAGGLIIGKITKLSDIISRDILSIKWQAAYSKLEQTAYAMIDKDGIYSDGKTQLEAYSRTLIADNRQGYSPNDISNVEFHRIFLQWRSWLHKGGSEAQTERPIYDRVIENTGTFVRKQFGLTESSFICLAPALCMAGDEICLIQGLDQPLVVREKGIFREFIGSAISTVLWKANDGIQLHV